MKMKKAIFIDRDGTINKLMPHYPNEGVGDVRNYVVKWEDFEFLPGAIEAFGLIDASEYIPIIVSNQGGAIGRKLVGFWDIYDVFEKMAIELWGEDENMSFIPKYYFCQHLISDNCACLKPKPGMLYQAAIEHNIDLSQSWMIGDSKEDILAGIHAGVKDCVMIADASSRYLGHHYEPSLLEAVKYIIAQG